MSEQNAEEWKFEKISKKDFENFVEVLKCPICLDVIKDAMTVKICLHKFCAECIEKYIRV